MPFLPLIWQVEMVGRMQVDIYFITIFLHTKNSLCLQFNTRSA